MAVGRQNEGNSARNQLYHFLTLKVFARLFSILLLRAPGLYIRVGTATLEDDEAVGSPVVGEIC